MVISLANLLAFVSRPRRADENDVWLRHLLTTSEIKKDRLRHPKIWQNGFKAPPRGLFRRRWTLEMSGRLLSRVAGIERFAVAKANGARLKHQNSSAKFSGVIFANVAHIRAASGTDGTFDVYQTHAEGDRAHADLTLTSPKMVGGEVSIEVWESIYNTVLLALPSSAELARLEGLGNH